MAHVFPCMDAEKEKDKWGDQDRQDECKNGKNRLDDFFLLEMELVDFFDKVGHLMGKKDSN